MTTALLVLVCLAVAGREIFIALDGRNQKKRQEQLLDQQVTAVTSGFGQRMDALGSATAGVREQVGALEQRLTQTQDDLTADIRDLRDRLANIERAIARDMTRLTTLEHEAPSQFADRLAALETAQHRLAADAGAGRTHAAALDRLERSVGELRQDLLDRVAAEVRDGTAILAHVAGAQAADQLLVSTAFERWADSADLRIRATETTPGHPWAVTYHLSGDRLAELPHDLLDQARETSPGSPLHDLITAVGSAPDGVLHISDFAAVRTSDREVLAAVLPRDPDEPATDLADRIRLLDPDLRCRLTR
jgi:hypothetical protein